MARTTDLVVAPSAPVAWSPGAMPLSDSLRARILAGAGTGAGRSVALMPASGRMVVTLPVGAARPGVEGAADTRRPSSERVAVPVVGPGPARSPWGEPDPIDGVVVRTSRVPTEWLRPATAAVKAFKTTAVNAVTRTAEPARTAVTPPGPARPPSTQAHRTTFDERVVSTSVRIRKAAMMAFGLLVSVVALEAAARVGRR